MIRFPKTLEQAVSAMGVVRAGGVDFVEMRELGALEGPIIDLRDLDALREIQSGSEAAGEILSIGALVTLRRIAEDPAIVEHFPGLSQAATSVATPQIRNTATLGGNLLQANRCWYLRNREFTCLKRGGSRCYAREGDHSNHGALDLGPCVAQHPSTVAVALAAYEGWVTASDGERYSVDELYGPGDAPTHHLLKPNTLLLTAGLPLPARPERAAYLRVVSRARSEWPTVEVVVRLRGTVEGADFARIALGGIAPIPLRLKQTEAALASGRPLTEDFIVRETELALRGFERLPMSGWKADVVPIAVADAVAAALADPGEVP